MMPPCLSCHSTTRRRNSSRPTSCRVLFSVLRKKFLDRRLRADAGMVGAGQPEDLESLHPGAPREDVLDRIVQDMPESQDAGDVRRRDHDRIGRLRRMCVRPEIAGSSQRAYHFGSTVFGS